MDGGSSGSRQKVLGGRGRDNAANDIEVRYADNVAVARITDICEQ